MPRQEPAVRIATAASVTAARGAPRVSAARRYTPRAVLEGPSDELGPLATASHDLRDPLQVIGSYVDLLADGFYGPVNSDQRAQLQRVRGHVQHLSALVSSILVLARATRGDLALELSDVPVRELLTEVRSLVEPFAAARGVSLVVDCEHAPATVRAERIALCRVLTNLASNAVKFTPRGGHVVLSAVDSPHGVELGVADAGPGIPPAQLEAIFEPFVQGQPTGDVERAGAGLGLTIARGLTRLMGGELLVRSTVGVGSLFTVRVPAA